MIANGEKVETKTGRYGGYTRFSDNLFESFKAWLERKPLPLMNRKEYEVAWFINELFDGESLSQHTNDGRIYDWYVPSKDLYIEFDELHHGQGIKRRQRDAGRTVPNLFIIKENSTMRDLARLAKTWAIRGD